MNRFLCRTSRGHFLVVALLIVFFSWGGSYTAAKGEQTHGDPQSVRITSNETEHTALRALVPMYEQAISEGKLEELEPYLDPEFSGVMVTGEEVDGFQGMVAYWKKIQTLIGEGGTYRVQVNVAGPALISDDMAVAHGTTNDEVVTGGGRSYEFESRWTAICRKRDGQWKVLRIQGTMDPVQNQFVQVIVQGASIFFGLVGFVVALVIGGLVCLVVIRRLRGNDHEKRPTS